MNATPCRARLAARRVCLVAAVLVAACVAACGEAEPPTPPPPPPGPPKLSLTPPWPKLDKGAALAERPDATNYYVVFDASGSMSEGKCADGSNKISVAKDAVKGFADTLPDAVNFGLLAFDASGVRERIPVSPIRSRPLEGTLAGIVAGGSTPLARAIGTAYEALMQQGRRQLGYGEYHLVVVTDGEYNPLSEDPRPIVAKILGESPVVIHTVGFCIDAEHSLNQPGKVLYTSASTPQELSKGLQAVLAEAPSFAVASFKP